MIGIIGTGGHAKVITDILKKNEQEQDFLFFTSSPQSSPFANYRAVKDSFENMVRYKPQINSWHVAIGNPNIRQEKMKELLAHRLAIISAIHHRSIIAKDCTIGSGTSIMAGAVINPQTTVGKGCIINTSASIDHDCRIKEYVNIGPGSHLAGNVTVGELTELGTGTIVIPNITIGKQCTIGAGAVVISDIPDSSVAVGVPAKIISKKIL